jgi:hypothetical protein
LCPDELVSKQGVIPLERGVIAILRPFLSLERSPISKHATSGKNKNMVMGPDTKNECADKYQQQCAGLGNISHTKS